MTAGLTQFQKFEVQRVHRSQLQNAPYNPRKIDKRAREKLQKNLKSVGLVEPPTWNADTGNIVSGHQRIAALDALEGTQDYSLDVAVVHMTDRAERQQNIFMNNPTTQGDYDMTMLATLLKDDGFDKAAAGFDRMDLETVFADDELATMFAADEMTKQVTADLARVGGLKAERQHEPGGPGEPLQAPGPDDPDGEPGDPSDPEDDPDGPVTGHTDGQEAPLQRRSDAVKEFMAGKTGGNDSETYAVVVFCTRREREIFMAACGQDTNTRYIDGVRVFSKLGVDPNDGQWAQAFDKPATEAQA